MPDGELINRRSEVGISLLLSLLAHSALIALLLTAAASRKFAIPERSVFFVALPELFGTTVEPEKETSAPPISAPNLQPSTLPKRGDLQVPRGQENIRPSLPTAASEQSSHGPISTVEGARKSERGAAPVPSLPGNFSTNEPVDAQQLGLLPNYPRTARERGQEGTTIYIVRVGASGNYESANLAQSSGYFILDDASRRTLETANFSQQLAGKELTIVFNYRLRRTG